MIGDASKMWVVVVVLMDVHDVEILENVDAREVFDTRDRWDKDEWDGHKGG